MNRSESSEERRLKEVYRGYSEDGRMSGRWSSANPGNQAMVRERRQVIHKLFSVCGFADLGQCAILDIGCGTGGELFSLTQWGADPHRLHGVDLLPDRISLARKNYPEIDFICGNAESLEYADGTFDLVMLFTVFSSIMEETMAHGIANEIRRVLKTKGGVLIYDFCFKNPYNRNVRGINSRDLTRYFPGYQLHARSVTLLPPLARKLGGWTDRLYPILAAIPFLRTHQVTLLLKK